MLDDLATMFADLGIHKSTQTLSQPDVCPFLVQAGKATISSHISRKDSCKPPFNAIVGQNGLPRLVDPSDISKHTALPLGSGPMSDLGVRRDKAALSSGCEPHPATAPAGSNRSSHGGNEVAEAFD